MSVSMLSLSPEKRPLGKSDILIPPLAWGMWRFGGGDVRRARERVEVALETGLTLFDTADVYGPDNGESFGAAEALLGSAIGTAPQLRDQMILATKGGIVPGVPYDSSSTYLASALESSLRRLGVDHVDLWQIHRPDLLAHPEEVARTLERMIESGKARSIGVSNFTAAQVAALQRFLPFPLASTQPQFSPFVTDPLWDGIIDQAMDTGMSVLAWSPLGGGRIGSDGDPVVALLDIKAAEYSVDSAAAALSWIMVHPSRPVPIVGTQSPDRIRAAKDALKISWTRAEWYGVLEASLGEKLP